MELYESSRGSKNSETEIFKTSYFYKKSTMITMHPQYITDHEGNKISVVLPIKEYENLLEELEEMEDLKLYSLAKDSNEPSYPIEEAFKMIEEARKSKT